MDVMGPLQRTIVLSMLSLASAAFAAPEGRAGTAASQMGQASASAPAVQRWFGVAVENIPPAIARQLKLKPEQGLMVMAVMPNSPAEKAGIKAYDLLVEVDGVPLMSQAELARAANAEGAGGAGGKARRITFLREGDRASIDLVPEPRPANMVVFGSRVGDFTGQPGPAGTGVTTQASDMRNYALPNGAAAQIGPGYRIHLGNGDGDGASAVTAKSIREIVARGQTVILSQETDAAGVVRNTISVGTKTYPVEAGKLDALPVELRPLGEELLASTPSQAATSPVSLEERVKELEVQNEDLRQQLAKLIGLLEKEKGGK